MFRYLSVSTSAGRSANGCGMTVAGTRRSCAPAGSGLYFLERRQRQRRRKRLHEGTGETGERRKERKKEREKSLRRGGTARFNFPPSVIAPCLLNRRKYWSSFVPIHPPRIPPPAPFRFRQHLRHLSRPSVGPPPDTFTGIFTRALTDRDGRRCHGFLRKLRDSYAFLLWLGNACLGTETLSG